VDNAKSPAKNADGKLRALIRGNTPALTPPARTVGGGATHRARVGLEDLDLCSLAQEVAPGRRTVVVAKHLCGVATDYALRSAVASRAAGAPPVAVVLSTCCHHRCTYQAYPNRPFLARLGLGGRVDFGMLCKVACWYVDGRHTVDDSAEASTRARVGACAKALLDEGRAEYLRAHGFDDTKLCRFVDTGVSPENMLLVASCAAAP
jgi:tRNA:m4X modification enzyme